MQAGLGDPGHAGPKPGLEVAMMGEITAVTEHDEFSCLVQPYRYIARRSGFS